MTHQKLRVSYFDSNFYFKKWYLKIFENIWKVKSLFQFFYWYSRTLNFWCVIKLKNYYFVRRWVYPKKIFEIRVNCLNLFLKLCKWCCVMKHDFTVNNSGYWFYFKSLVLNLFITIIVYYFKEKLKIFYFIKKKKIHINPLPVIV